MDHHIIQREDKKMISPEKIYIEDDLLHNKFNRDNGYWNFEGNKIELNYLDGKFFHKKESALQDCVFGIQFKKIEGNLSYSQIKDKLEFLKKSKNLELEINCHLVRYPHLDD